MTPRRRPVSDVNVEVLATREVGSPVDAEKEGGGPLDGGLLLLQRFTADVDDRSLDCLVTLTIRAYRRRLAVESVIVRPRDPGAPPVTGTVLRALTLDAYVQEARRVIEETPGLFLLASVSNTSEHAVTWNLPSEEDLRSFETGQRRRRSTQELLPQVADVYRAALADRDPRVRAAPTEEVGLRLHFSRGHAARLVTAARKAGLLGPASRGRAGEHLPAPATRKKTTRRKQ